MENGKYEQPNSASFRYENSEQIGDLFGALSKAQGLMSAAAKDSNNPFFNSKYADLSSVWNACRDALSKQQLAVVQTMGKDTDGEMYLATTLGHSSGQWMKSYLPIKIKAPAVPELDKHGKPKKINELQLLGSCLTYLRRYSLAAMVGVAPDEDDDGNGAIGYQAPKYKKDYYNENSPKPSEEIPDFNLQEVDEYLEKNWGPDKEQFGFFMCETMLKQNWNYRKCINQFEIQKDKTAQKFSQWVADKGKAV